MAMAAWKDLCIDAADPVRVGEFWASALGQELERLDDGDAVVRGRRLFDLWVNRVPEPKTVKNRVHLDLHAAEPQLLFDLGATLVADHEQWLVLADPEGNEMCVFDGDPQGAPAKVFAVCIDSAKPTELAGWWHEVLGGDLTNGPDHRPRWIQDPIGMDGLILKCVQVDDARSVKNRWHWDVTVADLDALVDKGATVLRAEGGDISWTVLADPEGNEFCAFAPER